MLRLKEYLRLRAGMLLCVCVAYAPAVLAQTAGQAQQELLLHASYAAANPPAAAPANSKASVAPHAAVPQQLSPEIIGDTLIARERYQAAIAAYARVPQMTAVLWDKTGVAYQMLLDFKDAARCYQEALRLNSNYAEAFNNLGTIYGIQNEFTQADKMYSAALKLNPNSAVYLRNLGTNLFAERKYARGWAVYQRALAIDPTVFTRVDGPMIGNSASPHERGAIFYYMALGCVRTGDVQCALEKLRTAMNQGFAGPKKVAEDKGFASLHNNPAFQQLLVEESTR